MNKHIFRGLLLALFLTPAVLILCKLSIWDYPYHKVLSKTSYKVSLNYKVEPTTDSVQLSLLLPTSGERQTIQAETNRSGSFNLLIQKGKNGRLATWAGAGSTPHVLSYSFEFLGYGLRYAIDTTLQVPLMLPADQLALAEPAVDSANRTELETVLMIHGPRGRNLNGVLDTLFDIARDRAQHRNATFVDLCRLSGIPTRVAGGMDLETEEHPFRHWAEVLVNETWVPFDPSRRCFARIPASYLKLYDGVHPRERHTANAGIEDWVEVNRTATINPELLGDLSALPMNAFSVWSAFEEAGIPLDILKVILLLPLGALVVALFRNVIGIATFGIFLPALIAMASRETGFLWGAFAFLLVIGIVSLVHIPLERWGLLSVPKITIMLVTVVGVFVVVSLIGVRSGYHSLAYVTLFPIVVVTISAERFATTMTQENLGTALRLTGQTLLVAAAAYVVMSSSTVEAMFLSFPELFLAIIALNLILGRWIGLRLTELFRFNWIIR